MTFEQKEPTTIFEDNFGCQCLTKDEVFHMRTKHIDISYRKIRELVKDETVAIDQATPRTILVKRPLTTVFGSWNA
jgi:hypothetical protein